MAESHQQTEHSTPKHVTQLLTCPGCRSTWLEHLGEERWRCKACQSICRVSEGAGSSFLGLFDTSRPAISKGPRTNSFFDSDTQA